MWPFRRKPVLDADTAAWHLENFEWLVTNYSRRVGFAQKMLILPAPGYFNNGGEEGHAKAKLLFEQVKAYCGIESYISLVPDDSIPQSHDMPRVDTVYHGAHAAGLYFSGRGKYAARIDYASHMLADIPSLIAVFAHELSHFVLDGGAPPPPPIEEDEAEFLTDLTAVFLGFGVFMANSAFTFQSFNEGVASAWQYSRQGYLPERDLVFATAIFIAVRELDPAPAIEHLKPHLGALLKRALRELEDDYATEITAIRRRGKVQILRAAG